MLLLSRKKAPGNEAMIIIIPNIMEREKLCAFMTPKYSSKKTSALSRMPQPAKEIGIRVMSITVGMMAIKSIKDMGIWIAHAI